MCVCVNARMYACLGRGSCYLVFEKHSGVRSQRYPLMPSEAVLSFDRTERASHCLLDAFLPPKKGSTE